MTGIVNDAMMMMVMMMMAVIWRVCAEFIYGFRTSDRRHRRDSDARSIMKSINTPRRWLETKTWQETDSPRVRVQLWEGGERHRHRKFTRDSHATSK